MNKSSFFIAATALVVILLVSSCSSSGAKTTTSGQPTVSTPATSQTTPSSQPATTTAPASSTPTSSTPASTGAIPVTTYGTALPPGGAIVILTDMAPGTEKTMPTVPHPITGAYENCLTCHYGPDAVGSPFLVDVNHPCDECHAFNANGVNISFDPTHYMGEAPTLPMQEACVLCHMAAS